MPDDNLIEPHTNDIPLGGRVKVSPEKLRVQFSRSSGPGGQNVNKVNTRCELWVKMSDLQELPEPVAARLRILAGGKLTGEDEIHIAADDGRSQERNRASALERLRELVLKALVVPKTRRKTKPSKGAKRRRLEEKKRRSDVKSGRKSGGAWE